MAISRVTAQDRGNFGTGNASSQALNWHIGTTPGDLLIVIANVYSVTGTPSNSVSPGTWNVIDAPSGDGHLDCTLFWKIADGTETSVTVSFGVTTTFYALGQFEYTGISNAVIDVSATGGSMNHTTYFYTMPSLTTTNANDLIFNVNGTVQVNANMGNYGWANANRLGAMNNGSDGSTNQQSWANAGEDIVTTLKVAYSDISIWVDDSYEAVGIRVAFMAGSAPPPSANGNLLAIM